MMKKLCSLFVFLLFMVGLNTSTWAANSCMPLAVACKQAGFYKGGNKVGKGLIVNCVMPIAMGNKTLPGTNFSDADKSACKTEIMQKMKNKQTNQ